MLFRSGSEFSTIYSGADDSLMLNASLAAKKDRTTAMALLSRLDGTSIYHSNTDPGDLQERTRNSGLFKVNHTKYRKYKAYLMEKERG